MILPVHCIFQPPYLGSPFLLTCYFIDGLSLILIKTALFANEIQSLLTFAASMLKGTIQANADKLFSERGQMSTRNRVWKHEAEAVRAPPEMRHLCLSWSPCEKDKHDLVADEGSVYRNSPLCLFFSSLQH